MEFKDLLRWVGAGAFVLIFLVFAIIWVAFYRGERAGFQEGAGMGVGGNCNILFPLSSGTNEKIGQAIDQWIAQHGPNSPLKGKGVLFAQSGRGSNINPAFIVAIARKESNFGTQGIATQGTYNPFGRTASADQPGVEINGRRWYKFSSWDEAIVEEGPYLKKVYVDDGRTTVGAVIEKYCPKVECDTEHYIAQMVDWINEITRSANGVLGAECVVVAEGEMCGLASVSMEDIDFQGARSSPQLLSSAVQSFNQLAADYHRQTKEKLPITSMFRTAQQQQEINQDPASDNPAAVCHSPHEAGWAFDANLQQIGPAKYEILKQIASRYNWRPINSNFAASEDHHFDHWPSQQKYASVQEGIVAATCQECVGA